MALYVCLMDADVRGILRDSEVDLSLIQEEE
jgi:hypothetical protein